MISESLIATAALAMIVACAAVSGRFSLCLIGSIRSRRYLASLASVLGIATALGALAALGVVWFAYAVAHVEKDAQSDLYVFLATVFPFFLVSAALWFGGGKLRRPGRGADLI